ncbi:MAG: hypothetical protein ABJF10_07310 [Chthoniobacter sp.]
MEYVTSIFIIGLMVSLLVAKGVMMAQEFTAEELERMEREKPTVDRKS